MQLKKAFLLVFLIQFFFVSFAQEPKLVLPLDPGDVDTAIFINKNSYLITLSQESGAMLWDVSLGKLLKVILNNRDSVLGFYYESNNGEYFCVPTRQKDSSFLYVYLKKRLELIRKINIPDNLNWITKLELRNPKNRNWLGRNIRFIDDSFITISANDSIYKWDLKRGNLSIRSQITNDLDYESGIYYDKWWLDDTTYFSSKDGKLIYIKATNTIFERMNNKLISRIILKGKIDSPLYSTFDDLESNLLISGKECLLVLSTKSFNNQREPIQVLPWQKIRSIAFDLPSERVAMFSQFDSTISIRNVNLSKEYLKIKTSKIIRDLQYDSSGKFLQGAYVSDWSPGEGIVYKAFLWNALTGDIIGEGEYWNMEMKFISQPNYDNQDPTKVNKITISLVDMDGSQLVYDSLKKQYYYSNKFNKLPFVFRYTQLSEKGLWRQNIKYDDDISRIAGLLQDWFSSNFGSKVRYCMINDSYNGKVFDLKTKTIRNDIPYGTVSARNTYIYNGDHGNITVFNANSGRELFSIYLLTGSNFLTLLPSKYYFCSPSSAKYLYYVTKDLKVITFEQLDIKYNRPDKVLEAIGNTDTALIKSYRKAWEKRIKKLGIDTTQFRDGYSVPEADFLNRDSIAYEQKTGTLQIHIRGTDSTYKLDRFNVWVNESPLFGQRGISIKRKNSNSLDTTITIQLSQGENRIETSITNVNGTESYRMPLYVNYTPAVKQKEMIRFIGIGIDQFKDSQHNLEYSSKDIRDLAVKLKQKYKDSIIIDTLFNENVTTINVKALKQKLVETSVNDKVIVSYSGHGLLSKEYDYYLSTYSVNFNKPEENGLPYDELESLLDSIPARKKLMLIDACHSGEVDKEEGIAMQKMADSLGLGKGIDLGNTATQTQHVGLKNSFELMQSLFVNVGKSTGATIISAAAGNQFALERGDLKNGVFTYSLLEAMNKYPSIKISELKKIVGERVEQLTGGLQKPTSRNETIAVDWSL